MDFTGRVAIVTGAARGIGNAIAAALAREGTKVILWDRDTEALAKAAAEFGRYPERPIAEVVDVTNCAQVEDFVQRVLATGQRIDILVNNAGISGAGLLKEMARTVDGISWPAGSVITADNDFWEQILRVNLLGTVNCCRAVLPHMIRQRRGTIVNLSSIAGKRGYPFTAPYCASKFAIIGLTQSLAAEVGQFGIRVNAVCPGWTDTELSTQLGGYLGPALGMPNYDALVRFFLQQQRIPILLKPAEIAEVVLFLMGDASVAMTGQAINISRGLEVS